VFLRKHLVKWHNIFLPRVEVIARTRGELLDAAELALCRLLASPLIKMNIKIRNNMAQVILPCRPVIGA
jgi:TorA maturation chaperone TorD